MRSIPLSFPIDRYDWSSASAPAVRPICPRASSPIGSAQHILALELGKLTGTDMVGVPYKGGADALHDVLAGRVQMYVSPTLAVLPPYKAGRVRLLAISSPERLAAAPEIPTLVEKGLPFVRFGWLGICVGSGTPQPIVSLLNRHVVTVVQSAEYREMAEKA